MKKKTWKEARLSAGLLQMEVAKRMGMSRELYNMKENYKRKMTIAEGLIFEKITGVPVENIILEKRE